MAQFRNFYRCADCNKTWADVWSAMCDDDCPHCGARHMSPYKSEDAETDDDAAPLGKAQRIRLLNDRLRTTFVGGKIMLTAGVDALPAGVKARVLSTVRSFADFDRDNDPHGEHDFGSFELEGMTYFFKFDYYTPDMEGGSEDPADPTKTTRVLTIMRADEY